MAEYFDGNPIEIIDPEKENLVFHYEQGSFRKRESQNIRDLATGKGPKKTGLFKVLVSNSGNKFLLFTMIVIIAAYFCLNIFRKPESDVISNVQCTASAFSFNDQIYATLELKKTSKKTDDLPVNLEILFECIDADNAVCDKYSENFSYIPVESELNQFVRTTFTDYEIKKLRVTVKSDDMEKVLTAGITQR